MDWNEALQIIGKDFQILTWAFMVSIGHGLSAGWLEAD